MCRTTLPLNPKRSDSRIVYNSREKEDSLSLKQKTKICYCLFFFSSPPRFLFLCLYSFFLLFFLFLFLSLSFSPHFLLSLCISLLLFGALTVWVKRRKFPPLLPQAKCVAFHFPSFSFISLFSFITSYPTLLHMSHGIMPPMWFNVSHPCGSM